MNKVESETYLPPADIRDFESEEENALFRTSWHQFWYDILENLSKGRHPLASSDHCSEQEGTDIKPRFFILFMLSACLWLCSCAYSEVPQVQDFDQLLSNFQEEHLQLNPLLATFLGDMRFNDQLPNMLTEQYREHELAFYKSYQDQLAHFSLDSLSPEQRISHQVLTWECQINLSRLSFPNHLLPIDQHWSLQLVVGQFGSGKGPQPFGNKQDYLNWLKRLDGFVAWCDTAIANMRKGMRQELVLPKIIYKRVASQLKPWAIKEGTSNHFYKPISLWRDSTSGFIREMSRIYIDKIDHELRPALSRLQLFMDSVYQHADWEVSGLGHVDKTGQWYQHQIESFTSKSITPDSLFQLGKSEIARLTKEMEELRPYFSYQGDDWEGFLQFLRTDASLKPFSSPEEVLDYFNDLKLQVNQNMLKLFLDSSKIPLLIERPAKNIEKSTNPKYWPGTDTRPGIFYLPIPDANHFNVLGADALFLHEGNPGHHHQSAIAFESNLPSFRKSLFYSFYIEGWALYCESEAMGKTLGLYQDTTQHMGRLVAEMNRAVRLVVDVGLHHYGWSRDSAVAYTLQYVPRTKASIETATERYMTGPGQALSYKIGELTMLSLNRESKQTLGQKFDIRRFHHELLKHGPLPLQLLENQVRQWMDSTRKDLDK